MLVHKAIRTDLKTVELVVVIGGVGLVQGSIIDHARGRVDIDLVLGQGAMVIDRNREALLLDELALGDPPFLFGRLCFDFWGRSLAISLDISCFGCPALLGLWLVVSCVFIVVIVIGRVGNDNGPLLGARRCLALTIGRLVLTIGGLRCQRCRPRVWRIIDPGVSPLALNKPGYAQNVQVLRLCVDNLYGLIVVVKLGTDEMGGVLGDAFRDGSAKSDDQLLEGLPGMAAIKPTAKSDGTAIERWSSRGGSGCSCSSAPRRHDGMWVGLSGLECEWAETNDDGFKTNGEGEMEAVGITRGAVADRRTWRKYLRIRVEERGKVRE